MLTIVLAIIVAYLVIAMLPTLFWGAYIAIAYLFGRAAERRAQREQVQQV